ncbi:hypothetical protein J6590_015956 [Homalodisca vitripennis]|nr:hypothetical protein J6590_015956 [Homalodisca vitripennis]
MHSNVYPMGRTTRFTKAHVYPIGYTTDVVKDRVFPMGYTLNVANVTGRMCAKLERVKMNVTAHSCAQTRRARSRCVGGLVYIAAGQKLATLYTIVTFIISRSAKRCRTRAFLLVAHLFYKPSPSYSINGWIVLQPEEKLTLMN